MKLKNSDVLKKFDVVLNDPVKLLELIANLNKKQFTLNDIGITARVHNAWRAAGIIPYAESDGKWVTYDFIQYLWLQLVIDMRTFGIPLNILAQTKDHLFRDLKSEEIVPNNKITKYIGEKFEKNIGFKVNESVFTEENIEDGLTLAQNFFQAHVLNHFLYRTNTTFYIFLDGYFEIWSDSYAQMQPEVELPLNEPHIALPFQYYFSNFLSDENKAEFLNTVPILNHEEKEVLQAMRNHQLKELTIKFYQDGKNRKIDIVTTADEQLTEEQSRQIIQILGLKNYQNVSLKKHNGSKLYFEREKRQKL